MAKKKGAFMSLTIDMSGMLRALRSAPKAVKRGIKIAVTKTTQKAFRRIKFRTPTDSGDALRGWKFSMTNGGSTGVIENNVDYINVIEFGGWPVRAKSRTKRRPPGSFPRGKAILSGHRPGRRTMAPQKGFDLQPRAKPKNRVMNPNVSRGAPHGMMRITFFEIEPEFARELEFQIDKAFAGLED